MSAQTLNRLRELKLAGMANALEHQQQQVSTFEGLAFTARLDLLLEREQMLRENCVFRPNLATHSGTKWPGVLFLSGQ